MVSAQMFGRKESNTLGIGKMANKMALAFIHTKMELQRKAIILMGSVNTGTMKMAQLRTLIIP